MNGSKQILPAIALLLAGCGEGREVENIDTAEAAPAIAATPTPGAKLAGATDRNWINISGEIVSTAPDSFMLDYGADNVTVEIDDWDWKREGRALAPGDDVVVTGRVDADLGQRKRIEASSVYAKNINTYFYGSGADEEDLAVSTVYAVSVPNYSDSTGFVTAVEGREFTLGANTGAVRVDTSAMADNPLDAEGTPQVKVGDRVYVWGDLDLDPVERTELKARGIVSLKRVDRTA